MHNNRLRAIKKTVVPQITTDGGGVVLRRAFGSGEISDIDPFLLFDHFGSESSDDYMAGFPMHPHRGIETVTYMLKGKIVHGDSTGNKGVIEAGGVQWMTAGSGIMHEEMPKLTNEGLEGFQLWVNLPSDKKMSAPRYQEFGPEEIPIKVDSGGNRIKVIAGMFEGLEGPVKGISGDPVYMDVSIAPGEVFDHVLGDRSAFVYLYKGSIISAELDGIGTELKKPLLLLMDGEGERIELLAGEAGASVIVAAGDAIGEPIARYGPFVMNTKDEIQTALLELRNGTFIKDQEHLDK
jgi:redox-sensitive bicupin YhaK (pirin superfamily)